MSPPRRPPLATSPPYDGTVLEMTCLRISVVAESFCLATDPSSNAATRTVRAVVDRLVECGHRVEVLAPGAGLTSYRGAPVRRIDLVSTPGAAVARALSDFDPSVVLCVGIGRLGRKALKHASKQARRTVAVQTTAVGERQDERWKSRVAGRADRILVTAPWLVDDLSGRGVSADLWLPGVDPEAFNPVLRDPELHASWARTSGPGGPKVVVGYVGSLHRRHGVRRLAALSEIPGIRLVVMGDGPQLGWLRARLPGARFTAELTAGHLSTALASLDVLVHPGEHETCCHALREAGASGVPVAALRAGGARDVVRQLETGVLADPDDPRDLVRAVGALAADRHRGLLGAHARELALRRSWRDAVDELVLEHLRHLPSEDLPLPGTQPTQQVKVG